MDYKPENLQQLFQDASEKANLTLEHADATMLAEEINSNVSGSNIVITDAYIYEAYRKIKAAIARGETSIDFAASYINHLAQYLGHLHFGEFLTQKEKQGGRGKVPNEQPDNPANSTIIYGKNVNKIEGDVSGNINNF